MSTVTLPHQLVTTIDSFIVKVTLDELSAVVASSYAAAEFIADSVEITYRRPFGEPWALFRTQCRGRRRLASGGRGKAPAERRYPDRADMPEWLRALVDAYAPQETR
jgi:hypothetical protein